MLEEEDFPENTLFCGDPGFVGYPLWSAIRSEAKQHFLVRVGANVDLLSEQADVKSVMAVAELIALREQINAASEHDTNADDDPQDRSLANTMRALRKRMRQLHKLPEADDDLLQVLSRAVVQRYNNRTNKQARYRPWNPDKKPLGDPNVTKISTEQLRKLKQLQQNTTA